MKVPSLMVCLPRLKAWTHRTCTSACGKRRFRGTPRTWISMLSTTYTMVHRSSGMRCRLNTEDDWNASLLVCILYCLIHCSNGIMSNSSISVGTVHIFHCNKWESVVNHYNAHCCDMGMAIKHSVPDGECQSARMSKITNDGLSPSGTGCFIAVTKWLVEKTGCFVPVKRLAGRPQTWKIWNTLGYSEHGKLWQSSGNSVQREGKIVTNKIVFVEIFV